MGIRPLRVRFGPLKDVVGFFGSLPTENLDITRCAARWDGVSIVRIVSLSSCHHEPRRQEIKNNRVRLCLHMYLYCITVVVDIITAVVYNTSTIF